MRRIGFGFSYLLLILVLVLPVTASASDWTSIGPGNMSIRGFAVSPGYATDHEIVVLYGNSQPTNVRITHDGGVTWASYQLAGRYGMIDDVAYGSSPDIIHLPGSNGNGFISSYDGGATWVQHSPTFPGRDDLYIWPNIWDISVKGNLVAMSGNSNVGISRDDVVTTTWIQQNSTNGLPAGSYESIEISPDGSLILLGTNCDEVYRSTDGGFTWSWSGTGLPASNTQNSSGYINDLLITPTFAQDHTVFAQSGGYGVYKSTDEGVTWRLVLPQIKTPHGEMVVSPSYSVDGTIFCTGYGGAYISKDRGESWIRLDENGLPVLSYTYPLGPLVPSPEFGSNNLVFMGMWEHGLYSTQSLTPYYPMPAPQSDTFTTIEDQVLTVAAPGILGNDAYVTGGSAAVASGPLHGLVTLNTDGSFTYTPTLNYNGLDTFTYTVTVGTKTSAPATVTIGVTEVYEDPIAAFTFEPTVPTTLDTVTFTDGSTDDETITSYYWNFGDGATSNVQSPTHRFVSANTYTVTLIVHDNDGKYAQVQHQLSVTQSNLPPVVAAGIDLTGTEGTPVALSGTYTDTGDTGIHTIAWDFGDGSTKTGTLTPSHTYVDNGQYTATLTVTDAAGAAATDTLIVTIANAVPVVDAGIDKEVITGAPVVFTGTFTDTGTADSHTFAWVFGDSSSSVEQSPTHAYSNAGSYTATLTVTDDDGGSGSDSVTVTVTDPIPVANDDAYTTTEDQQLTVATVTGVLFNDIALGTATASEVTPPSNGTVAVSADGSFTYTPAANFHGTDTFTYTVIAGTQTSSPATVMITVIPVNDPSVVGVLTPSLNPVSAGTAVTLSASFTDPDIGDTHSATWIWGDGLTSSGGIDESLKTVTGTHEYSVNGVYTIVLTLTDIDGSQSQSEYQYIVVYSPASGYVSGHGRIYSPAGAYKTDLSLAGDASFGFVSKYQRGAKTPDGSTRFRFQVADFEFKSTSYDWLVITGAKAQYKGLGEINGQGQYKFMLSAIDADQNPSDSFTVDRFRLKIWTEDASGVEQVVYDNSLGTEVDLASLTEISKGEIDIRKEAP